MLKLADRALLDRVGMIGAYKKGIDYYKNGRVKDVKTNQSHDYFVANVHGSSVYEAKAKFNSRGEIINTYCDCFAFGSYYGDCKHIIALLLTIRDFQERGIFNHKNPEGDIRNILNQYRDQIDNPLIPVNLEVNFEFEYHEFLINLRIGEDKYYVVRNLRNFLWDLSNKKTIEFGKNFTYYPDIHMFNPKDKEIIDFLTILAENGEEGNGYHMGSNVFSGKNIRLGRKSLEKFLDIMNSREFNIKYYNHEYENIKITEEKLNLNFLLEENQKDLILKIDEEVPLVPITHNGKYFFYKDKVYKLSPEQRNIIMPLWNEMEDNESDRIRIDEELKQIFVSEILPRIKKYSSLSIDEKVEESIYSYPFQGTMYFDRKDHIIQGRVIFNYGDIEINPFSSKGNIDLGTGKILLRDMETERAIMSLLELGDFKVADGGFYLEEEEEIFDFLKDVIPQLQNYCEIYYSEDFKKSMLLALRALWEL